MTSLVYVRGLRGRAPEKWPDDAPPGVKSGKRVIAAFALPASEAGLSLDELVRRHPLPAGAAREARNGD
jgi:hypothetical protein